MPRAFDSWRSISLSLYMVLTGYAVLVGIPVISAAWVAQLGFSATQAGHLAAADLGGLSLGAVLCSRLIARLNRRHLVVGAVLLAVAANLGCIFATDHATVMALRLGAGIGSGVYTAVAVAALGATSNPVRAYSWVLFAFAIAQALELSLLPLLALDTMYLVFAASFALALPFIRWLPARAEPRPAEATRPTGWRSLVPWLVLLAICFTYTDIGAYWTYIELATVDSAASPGTVRQVLVWSALFSILGCVAAGWTAKRFGLLRPLVVILGLQAVVVGVLVGGLDDTRFMLSVFGFNFLWMFSDIFQLATVAGLDPDGRFAALVPGAQGLGQIVGPTIGASLLGGGAGFGGVFALCAGASLSAMAIYVGLNLWRGRATVSARG